MLHFLKAVLFYIKTVDVITTGHSLMHNNVAEIKQIPFLSQRLSPRVRKASSNTSAPMFLLLWHFSSQQQQHEVKTLKVQTLPQEVSHILEFPYCQKTSDTHWKPVHVSLFIKGKKHQVQLWSGDHRGHLLSLFLPFHTITYKESTLAYLPLSLQQCRGGEEFSVGVSNQEEYKYNRVSLVPRSVKCTVIKAGFVKKDPIGQIQIRLCEKMKLLHCVTSNII